MVSFLSSPKPFVGIDAQNQTNAIRNWLTVHPKAEVILFGNSEGAHHVAQTLGVRYVPQIAANENGLPYFNAIVEYARLNALYETQVYLNCDILLPPNFLLTLQRITAQRFLLVGQRIDLAVGVRFQTRRNEWDQSILHLSTDGQAALHGPEGIDYFGFPRGLWKSLPNLLVGRGAYDNALLAYCLRNKVPIYDATRSLHVVHQYHDYGHVAKGKSQVHFGPEAILNRRLHDIEHSPPIISDADFELCPGFLRRSRCRGDWLRFIEITLRYRYRMKNLSYLCRLLWRFLAYFGYALVAQPNLNQFPGPEGKGAAPPTNARANVSERTTPEVSAPATCSKRLS